MPVRKQTRPQRDTKTLARVTVLRCSKADTEEAVGLGVPVIHWAADLPGREMMKRPVPDLKLPLLSCLLPHLQLTFNHSAGRSLDKYPPYGHLAHLSLHLEKQKQNVLLGTSEMPQ